MSREAVVTFEVIISRHLMRFAGEPSVIVFSFHLFCWTWPNKASDSIFVLRDHKRVDL
jgi:hypothetical protein